MARNGCVCSHRVHKCSTEQYLHDSNAWATNLCEILMHVPCAYSERGNQLHVLKVIYSARSARTVTYVSLQMKIPCSCELSI